VSEYIILDKTMIEGAQPKTIKELKELLKGFPKVSDKFIWFKRLLKIKRLSAESSIFMRNIVITGTFYSSVDCNKVIGLVYEACEAIMKENKKIFIRVSPELKIVSNNPVYNAIHTYTRLVVG